MESSVSKDVERSLALASIKEAQVVYHAACSRILSVNEWNKAGEGMSVHFQLRGNDGHEVNHRLRPHDVLVVSRHSPDNDCCLEVQRVKSYKKPSGKDEFMAVEVRFFPEDNGGPFHLVEMERHNNIVTIRVRSEGELTGEEGTQLMSPIQWHNLISKILAA